jgi:hypothetical protein
LIFSNLLGGGRNKDKNKLFLLFFLVDFVQRRARENPKNNFSAKTLKIIFIFFHFHPLPPIGNSREDLLQEVGKKIFIPPSDHKYLAN